MPGPSRAGSQKLVVQHFKIYIYSLKLQHPYLFSIVASNVKLTELIKVAFVRSTLYVRVMRFITALALSIECSIYISQ